LVESVGVASGSMLLPTFGTFVTKALVFSGERVRHTDIARERDIQINIARIRATLVSIQTTNDKQQLYHTEYEEVTGLE